MAQIDRAESWLELLLNTAEIRIIESALDAGDSVVLHGPQGFGLHRVLQRLTQREDAEVDQPGNGEIWRVVVRSPGGTTQTIAGRRSVGSVVPGAWLGPAELALRTSDLPDDVPSGAHELIERCSGWWDRVVAESTHLDVSRPQSPNTTAAVAQLIERCLEGTTESQRAVASTLAFFERFTRPMVSALDGTATPETLLEAGLPVLESAEGWMTLLEPVRSTLRSEKNRLTIDEAAQLVRPLHEAFGPAGAAEALIEAGCSGQAADLLSSALRPELDRVNPRRLLALLQLLQTLHPEHGRLTFLLATAHGDLAMFSDQRQRLREAVTIAESVGDDALATEAAAELLLLDEDTLPSTDVNDRLRELRSRKSAELNQLAKTRLDEVEALLLAQSGDLADIHTAAERLELIAHRWELLDQRARAAHTIRRLAGGCLLHLGEYVRALDLLERAARMIRDQPDAHLRTNRLQMFFSARNGDNDAFAAFRDLDIELMGRTEAARWLDAYRSWAEMLHASFNSSSERVRQAHGETAARLGELEHTPTGALFLADTAICFATTGDEPAARAAQLAIRDRSDLKPIESLLVDATIEGRFGTAEALDDVVARGAELGVPAARAWRVAAARLTLGKRLGIATDATPEAVIADAERFGLDHLARRILDLGGVVADEPTTRVEVLGALRITVGDGDAVLPPGKVTELLKLLVVRDQQVPLDVVVDHLWPDADLQRGRARLRNCVNRLRKVLGPETLVRSGDTLALSRGVSTDLRDFWTAIESLGAVPTAARTAAELYVGNLLEADLYEDWLYSERIAVASAMERALDRGLSAGTLTDEQVTTIRHRLDRLD